MGRPLAFCLSHSIVFFIFLTINDFNLSSSSPAYAVKVFYHIVHSWGASVIGNQSCGNQRCEWTTAGSLAELAKSYNTTMEQHARLSSSQSAETKQLLTVAVYNVHTLHMQTKLFHPSNCDLPVNYTMGTSEESRTRYGKTLFDVVHRYYDGFAGPHPDSAVQRIYSEAYLNDSWMNPSPHNFSYLIKAAAFVASNCHTDFSGRNNAVNRLKQNGVRVDGLAKCFRSIGPEGVTLPQHSDMGTQLLAKRAALSRYAFYLAFENTNEPGYVTEKPWDAMMAGSVPIYLGDAAHLKSLLPHPKAAIFVADFPDISSLASYLKKLIENETAYEEHRAWRYGFSSAAHVKSKPMLETDWGCRVCRWAVKMAETAPYNESVARNKSLLCHSKTN